MLKHPYTAGFKQAIKVKINTFIIKKIWKKVPINYIRKVIKKLISITQVYKYKLNNKGYFIKFKARLYTKSDL